MKKGLLIVFSLLIVTCVFAYDQGTINPGGNVSFSNFKAHSTAESMEILTFTPQMGYFIVDNLATDLMINWISARQGEDKTVQIGFGIGARYFINNLYTGASLLTNTNSSQEPGMRYKSSANYLILKAGYMIPVVENVSIDTGLNYQMGIGEYSGDGNGNNETRQINFTVGLQVFIPKTK